MKRVLIGGSACLCVVLGTLGVSLVNAQGQATAIVIDGGTLVDGNGGTPVANVQVVIQGNRITRIGRKGQGGTPAGAQLIHADGKFIVPGLIDAKSNYAGDFGEAYLMWGVTSVMASGEGGDVSVADRDAINHGIYVGPRVFLSYAGISGPGVDGKAVDGTVPGRGGYVVHTPAEAAMRARQFLSAGADMIYTNEGSGSPELYQAAVEEAHRAGKPAVLRAVGPTTRAREAALIGADILVHSGEAGVEMAKDYEKWKNYINLPPDPYSDIDESKVPGMINVLVDHHVALEPDLIATARGFPKNWKRVQEEDANFFNDPALRAYFADVQIKGVIENVKSPETYLKPDEIDLRARGFKNQMTFLKRFVDAGGHLVAASDIPQSVPGLGVLQEMAVFQEDAGLSPMQALQAGSKWVAEAFKQKDIGSLEVGKLADVVIVNDDPTKDVLNLRKIDTVIKDGKVVDRVYHANYAGMTIFASGNFKGGVCCFSNPVVESAQWTAALKQATWRPNSLNGGFAGAGGIDSEAAPTPGIESILPYTIPQNSPTATVTIKGFNFVRGSVVMLDGQSLPTKVVSRTELQATIDGTILAKPKKYILTVRNPAPVATPDWGDTSNRANLLVPYSFTTAYSQNKF